MPLSFLKDPAKRFYSAGCYCLPDRKEIVPQIIPGLSFPSTSLVKAFPKAFTDQN